MVTAPLEGIRVVEVASWMAAPSAAAVLADLGATVIKVEPLSGDAVRGLIRQPVSPPGRRDIDYSFTADNRGKRSLAVAIDRQEGADVVRALVATADVFLSNLLPKRQKRFGLDPAALFAVRPSLVHASLTGYGLRGPDANRPGFDVTTFFGRGGITDAMTDPGGVAPQPRPAQGDHTTGLALTTAILAALRVAERTGEGQVVDVSLLATAAWTMASDLSAVLVDGRQPTKRDRHHVISALSSRYRCGDDRWIVLNMPEGSWWPRFCRTMGHEEWLADERFSSLRARFDNMGALVDLIDQAFASASLQDWGRRFDRDGLIWGAAGTMAELVADPQAEATELFPLVHHPGGAFRTVGVPFRISGADVGPRGSAPEVGEHSREALQLAGFEAAAIQQLFDAGVVGETVRPSS